MSALPATYPPLPLNFTVLRPDHGDHLSVGQSRLIVRTLCSGGIAWVKSDCAYALLADPRHPLAIAAVDALLDHAAHPIPLTTADEPMASRYIRFNSTVRALTAKFWPGPLGLRTSPTLRARKLTKRLHAPEGVVTRVSQSVIERQISATAGVALTSAAMRQNGQLVADREHALTLALILHEERTPGLRTIFVDDSSERRFLIASTMLDIKGGSVGVLRHGSVDVHDALRAAPSRFGVDWSEST